MNIKVQGIYAFMFLYAILISVGFILIKVSHFQIF